MILSTAIRSWLERPIRWVKAAVSLQGSLIVLLVVLFLAFVAVMVSETVEKCVGELLGLGSPEKNEKNEKNEILTFLGIGMGGILLALQAVIANRRAKAMEDTAKAQAKATEEQAKANENTERGQRQERLKNAIEHLGHDSDSVRLGGAYELFHLAQDNSELRQTVLDILCAHIRQTTGKRKYREDYPSKPSEEVQSLLTLLFVQEYKVFKGCHVNLQGSWLNGAKLNKARLQGANLVGAHLYRAKLFEAHLHRADLTKAHLPGAILSKAHLEEATLREAHLQRADLSQAHMQRANLMLAHLQGTALNMARLHEVRLNSARLQGADLTRAYLQGALLIATQLHGANLRGTYLLGADLTEACLHGAILIEAYLQGAKLHSAQLQGARSYEEDMLTPFADRMRNAINKESNLSEVTFTGELSRDDLDYFVKDLSVQKAGLLRAKLQHHIDKPASHQLPDGSEANTGAYTEEEAEQWIAEYEEAMSAVPKPDQEL